MRRTFVSILTVAVALVAVSSAMAAEGGDRVADLEKRVAELEKEKGTSPESFRVYWKNGLKFDSNDGEFQMQVGGRIMNDWMWWISPQRDVKAAARAIDASASLQDGTEFRRARIFIAGKVYRVVKFKAQYDFAGGDADWKDVYIELTKVPVVGNVKVGHFKEPMGLEELTSSKYITFMERALPMAFVPSRNTGLMVHDVKKEKRMTWAVGIFRDAGAYGDSSGSGDYAGTARWTWVPYQDEERNLTTHVGGSYSFRSPLGDTSRVRQRPENHQAPYFVDTGSFGVDSVNLYGVEGAIVIGPFSAQAEYLYYDADATAMSDPQFNGWYAQVSYFLTGEQRPYKKGSFSRIKPITNFMNSPGPGAWEVAARYSTIDLNDGGAAGGEMDDVTLGVNWYLNPNTRVMWNWVHADIDSVGDQDAFQMRFQIDF